ncbi:MAG: hypothetical protein FJW23_14850 [Acidimicrobiia bacterium]|nr:hypothetical protein [Acidimicrobiia bacterium]
MHPLYVYLALCVAIAFIGRRRILGFWGNFILAFFVSPLVVAIILFAGTLRRKAPSPPPKPAAG